MTGSTELDQGLFLDWLRCELKLKNDAALARKLDVNPPQISKIRSGAIPIGASFLIRAHELTDIPTKQLKAIIYGEENKHEH